MAVIKKKTGENTYEEYAIGVGIEYSNATTTTDGLMSKEDKAALANKVDKIAGKALSDNNYSSSEKSKLLGVEDGAQVNIIESIKVNGTSQSISSKSVDIAMPVSTSELENDSNFAATNANNNFSASQTFNGDVVINGDIYQNGDAYETHAESLFTKNDIVKTRDGAVVGLAADEYTGFEAVKYDGENNGQLVFDSSGTARVGDVGSTQPLMTRDDASNIADGQALVWDGINHRAIGGDSYAPIYTVTFSGSGAGTRCNAAAGMVANVAVGDQVVVNDFDYVPFYNRPICNCVIDATTNYWRVTAYKGDPDFAWDGSNGEVMYECTPCAYSEDTDLTNKVSVTGVPRPGFRLFGIFPDWHTKAYLPVFNMGYVDGKATSRAGIFPAHDSLNGFMNKARAFNANAHTETIKAYWYESCLQEVEFATRDFQSIMYGAGNMSYNSATTKIASVTSDTEFVMDEGTAANFVAGQTVSIGSTQNGSNRTGSVKISSISGDTVTLATAVSGLAVGDYLSTRMYECGAAALIVTNASSGSPVSNSSGKYPCIWRGKENPWAMAFSTICDCLTQRSGAGTEESPYSYTVYHISDATEYNNGSITSDYVNTNIELPTVDGYAKAVAANSDVFCTSQVGASSSTYHAAYYYYPRYDVCAFRVGGNWAYGRYCGLCFNCYYAPSSSGILYAARLLLLPR